MNTTPLDDDEALVAWALACGPGRGLVLDQLDGRVALAPARLAGAVRRLVERGAVHVTPSGFHKVTPVGRLLVGATVAGEASEVRDAGAVEALATRAASYRDVAEVCGLASPSTAHTRYAAQVAERTDAGAT